MTAESSVVNIQYPCLLPSPTSSYSSGITDGVAEFGVLTPPSGGSLNGSLDRGHLRKKENTGFEVFLSSTAATREKKITWKIITLNREAFTF